MQGMAGTQRAVRRRRAAQLEAGRAARGKGTEKTFERASRLDWEWKGRILPWPWTASWLLSMVFLASGRSPGVTFRRPRTE